MNSVTAVAIALSRQRFNVRRRVVYFEPSALALLAPTVAHAIPLLLDPPPTSGFPVAQVMAPPSFWRLRDRLFVRLAGRAQLPARGLQKTALGRKGAALPGRASTIPARRRGLLQCLRCNARAPEIHAAVLPTPRDAGFAEDEADEFRERCLSADVVGKQHDASLATL